MTFRLGKGEKVDRSTLLRRPSSSSSNKRNDKRLPSAGTLPGGAADTPSTCFPRPLRGQGPWRIEMFRRRDRIDRREFDPLTGEKDGDAGRTIIVYANSH